MRLEKSESDLLVKEILARTTLRPVRYGKDLLKIQGLICYFLSGYFLNYI